MISKADKKNYKGDTLRIVVGITMLAILLAGSASAAESSGTVIRSFSSPIVAPGATTTVTLTPGGVVTEAFYMVVETLPPGFTFGTTSADSTQDGQVVTFISLSGSAFTYTVTAPLATGTFTFSGTFKDANLDTGNVGGSSVINVGTAEIPQQIQQITTDIQGLVTSEVMNQGQGNSLTTKLESATKNLNDGNTNVAINKLQAFIKEVQAYIRARILTQAQGQELIDAANAVISQLVG